MTRRRELLPQNQMLQEFKKYEALLDPTKEKRKLVLKANPHHYSFGNIRPVWKTWKTYAQNMELISPSYEESDA